ncbi:F-box/LRR-repeat protein 20-like [Montipora capricornis]|uniref:F-box/LRR-repeat protein 20-like n=1 Tax=Montipora capricornis TaxID=246305 RepID=UPI0035F15C22
MSCASKLESDWLTGVFLERFSKTRGTSGVASVVSIHDEELLRIFSFLPLVDLTTVSCVCRRWYKLTFDHTLWREVDLKRFSRRFTDSEKLDALVLRRFSVCKIQRLDLSGFTVSEETLHILNSSCKTLKALTLKNVTFSSSRAYKATKSQNTAVEIKSFPSFLEYLDIRFSQGHCSVYRKIASSLSNIKQLGVCNTFVYTLMREDILETTVEKMRSLRELDFSQCLLLRDDTLSLFARCGNLQVLSVRKCYLLTGIFIQDFLQICKGLKTLILDGVSIDDSILLSTRWDNSCLTHLDIGWLPLVTPLGLNAVISWISKIDTLEYLRLSVVGDSEALNHKLLYQLRNCLLGRTNRKSNRLNLHCFECALRNGFGTLRHFVCNLDTTRCPVVRISFTKTTKEKPVDNNYDVSPSNTREARKRNRAICSSRVFRSTLHTLETPV